MKRVSLVERAQRQSRNHISGRYPVTVSKVSALQARLGIAGEVSIEVVEGLQQGDQVMVNAPATAGGARPQNAKQQNPGAFLPGVIPGGAIPGGGGGGGVRGGR